VAQNYLWLWCQGRSHRTGLARHQPCGRKVCRVTWDNRSHPLPRKSFTSNHISPRPSHVTWCWRPQLTVRNHSGELSQASWKNLAGAKSGCSLPWAMAHFPTDRDRTTWEITNAKCAERQWVRNGACIIPKPADCAECGERMKWGRLAARKPEACSSIRFCAVKAAASGLRGLWDDWGDQQIERKGLREQACLARVSVGGWPAWQGWGRTSGHKRAEGLPV